MAKILRITAIPAREVDSRLKCNTSGSISEGFEGSQESEAFARGVVVAEDAGFKLLGREGGAIGFAGGDDGDGRCRATEYVAELRQPPQQNVLAPVGVGLRNRIPGPRL